MNDAELQTFKRAYQEIADRLGDVAKKFPWEEREPYLYWLAQTYYHVIYSSRLLANAAARIPREYEAIHVRFLKHIREEITHEKLAVHDIKQLGSDITLIPELPETKAFVQSQSYWTENISPFSFFGYILALEGLAAIAGMDIVERTRAAHGDKATVFLKVHAEEDQDHIKEAFEQIQSLPYDEAKLIIENMAVSARMYSLMLQKIASLHDTRQLSFDEEASNPLSIKINQMFQMF